PGTLEELGCKVNGGGHQAILNCSTVSATILGREGGYEGTDAARSQSAILEDRSRGCRNGRGDRGAAQWQGDGEDRSLRGKGRSQTRARAGSGTEGFRRLRSKQHGEIGRSLDPRRTLRAR